MTDDRSAATGGWFPEDLGALSREVAGVTKFPRDSLEVAAVLESMSWTDSLALERFGFEDVFELAQAVFRMIPSITAETIVRPRKIPVLLGLLIAIKQFLRGTMFAMPMTISIAAMLTIRYSLWSYQYFSVENATAIAAGTAMSFVATGGFTQAIARRGLMYISQDEYGLARRLSFRIVTIGVITTLVVGVGVFFINWAFAVFPWSMAWFTFVYYLFLSAIWLSITILYMLRREVLFTLVMTAGIGIVILLHEKLRLTIITSQILALSITAVASLGLAAHLFLSAERRKEHAHEVAPLPRASLVVYTSVPYFVYGLMYFAFLYLDRMISWSTNDVYMPYVIWFRGQYELGLDWAILSLIIPMGAVEMILEQFVDSLLQSQKTISSADSKEYGRMYVRMYTRQLALYSALSAASGYFMRQFIISLEKMKLFDVYVSTNPVSWTVFNWSLVAYVFLAAGLLNALVLFCLSRPEMAVTAISEALIVDFAVGFVASRVIGYQWAVAGLLAGAVVFAVAGSRGVFKVLRSLDYYYYASL